MKRRSKKPSPIPVTQAGLSIEHYQETRQEVPDNQFVRHLLAYIQQTLTQRHPAGRHITPKTCDDSISRPPRLTYIKKEISNSE